ncbi:MAG: hypothetical protein JWQ40_3428 [Segetibacter sp.]|jgi:hypothetical protein|nr:hypothetical protein [Segetibacter sp.]
MKWLFILLLFTSFTVNAQWKSYRLINNGDTINRIDQKDLRQGRWSNKVESIRGEPGYDEEGIYKDGKKEGVWRIYTRMGDLLGIERYRWGNKDGKSQYYDISGLTREESWKAVNPDNPFDTVDVFDPVDPNKVQRQVIKIEGTSVKHGIWKYFASGSGAVIRSETYFLGKMEDPRKIMADATASSESSDSKTTKPPVKAKPKEVMEFEKKVGKKKVKVIDGTTL